MGLNLAGLYSSAAGRGKSLRLTAVEPKGHCPARQAGRSKRALRGMSFASDGRGLDTARAGAPAAGTRSVKLQPLRAAGSLYRPLSRPRARRAGLAGGRRAHHADRAGRGAPHDRLRLLGRGGGADRQLFRGDDRGGRRARGRQRLALLPRHHARRAHRRRSARRRVRASHPAVVGVLRYRQDRRDGVAAHRRHHPDQVGGRRLGVDRAAQCWCCSSAAPR